MNYYVSWQCLNARGECVKTQSFNPLSNQRHHGGFLVWKAESLFSNVFYPLALYLHYR